MKPLLDSIRNDITNWILTGLRHQNVPCRRDGDVVTADILTNEHGNSIDTGLSPERTIQNALTSTLKQYGISAANYRQYFHVHGDGYRFTISLKPNMVSDAETSLKYIRKYVARWQAKIDPETVDSNDSAVEALRLIDAVLADENYDKD